MAPLPPWAGYLILTALGLFSVGLVAFIRRARGSARDISWFRHGRRWP
jgi:hypothetical protein